MVKPNGNSQLSHPGFDSLTVFDFDVVLSGGVHWYGCFPSDFDVMLQFMPRFRKENPGAKSAMIEESWKKSSERAAVLAPLSEAEIKRRKY